MLHVLLGIDAYPTVLDAMENSSMECSLPTHLSFTAREIADGTFFKAIEDYDPDTKMLLHQLQKYDLFCKLFFVLSIHTVEYLVL